jgi:hypothetical protein
MRFSLSLFALLSIIGGGPVEASSATEQQTTRQLQQKQQQHKSYGMIAAYQPVTLVTDSVSFASCFHCTHRCLLSHCSYLYHLSWFSRFETTRYSHYSKHWRYYSFSKNAIDLDLEAIENQFDIGTKVAIETAERIYREGAFSHPGARLQLDSPLTQDVPKGTQLRGVSSKGGIVFARAKQFWARGDTAVLVEYPITSDQSNVSEWAIFWFWWSNWFLRKLTLFFETDFQYARCLVGANPNPIFDGCLINSGVITVPDLKMTLPYSYDLNNDNLNFRAIEGFSKFAADLMVDCGGSCPYPEFEKFVKYYGIYDYGNHIISAAFKGGSTFLNNGNMDFSLFGDDARTGTTTTCRCGRPYFRKKSTPRTDSISG